MPLFSATEFLTLPELTAALRSRDPLRLPAEAESRMQAGCDYLHQHFAAAPSQPPANLLMAHACGTGAEVPAELVRRLLLLKVQSLSGGHSGGQVATARRLLDFFNRDVWPVVYEQGGDQAPLAHLCLPLLGLGEVNYQGYRLAASDVNSLFGWEPLALHAQEGQALLTGPHFGLAYATEALERAQRLLDAADVIGAISLAALGGDGQAFAAPLHRGQPLAGQARVAERLRGLLAGSEQVVPDYGALPDAASFQYQPQVHGASRDAVAYVAEAVATACNAVTDDPAVFAEEEAILSGGRAPGQPLALALDHLALAVAGLGSISAQRTAQLVAGPRGLPPGLVDPGFVPAQRTAASLVSLNKQLCTPASADSSLGSDGPADRVSGQANAAPKARRVVENTEQILGIELLAAAQALDLRHPARRGPALAAAVAAFREVVAFAPRSRVLYPDLHRAANFVRDYAWE
ncbi:MAG: aromatic amino acid lyase [Hymenobacter sp.]|nr:MAG: aromatic amino acid lyase [Hymenobacter sp.]